MKTQKLIKIIFTSAILIGILLNFSSALAEPGDIIRVSVGWDGTEADDDSFKASISANGRYVAFYSDATNLVPEDTNGVSDAFVRDLETGETIRVSVTSEGLQTYGDSGLSDIPPSLSADGRYVAFTSNDGGLVEDGCNWRNVYVHDLLTGETTLVSGAPDGINGNNVSSEPSISADGRFISFTSASSNLVPGDTNRWSDIFVRDMQSGTTSRVSVASDGSEANRFSSDSKISADGRFIVFPSEATNLVAGDTSIISDIFIHDMQTGTTNRVSKGFDGSEADSSSFMTVISDDNNYVVFSSRATNLVAGDTNGYTDVFVYNIQTGETKIVSVSSDGTLGNDDCYLYGIEVSISADGRYIAFLSDASNLVVDDTNSVRDVFVHDMQTGETVLASRAPNGTISNRYNGNPSLSSNGQYVAFSSSASNLVSGDLNYNHDIFVSEVSWQGMPPTPVDPQWLLIYYFAADNDLNYPFVSEVIDIANVENSNIDIAIFHDSAASETWYKFYSSDGDRIAINQGELNSGDGNTLVNYINWAKSQSDASNVALILADHGHALAGFGTDESSGDDSILVDTELPQALVATGPFDVIYAHACLMANIEFLDQIRGTTNYFVGHESKAWAPITHSDYLDSITNSTTPYELAGNMAYAFYDEISNARYDDGARAKPSTVSMVDMSYIDTVVTRSHALGNALDNSSLATRTEIWLALKGPSPVLQHFDESCPFLVDGECPINITRADRLVDLFQLAEIVREYPEVQEAADSLLDVESQFVLYNAFWSGYPYPREKYDNTYWSHEDARGVSVTFPYGPISFYKGEYLDFAEGADWSAWTGAAPSETGTRSVSGWGLMITNMINQFNPDEEDQPDIPELVPLLTSSEFHDLFIPLLIK